MSKASTIKLNPNKGSDLEFDVVIQGIDDADPPVVKFVITSNSAGCGYTFTCSKVTGEKDKWLVKLPELTHIKEESPPFHVEVIVDGYYFQPAEGTITFVGDPTVKFAAQPSKPSVTTSFTVKERDDKKETVKESDITGQYAPTNGLLKTEFPPPESHAKTPGTEANDETIDPVKLDDIASSVLPGETTDPEPESSENDEDLPEFDPRRVAEAIVKNTFGSIKKPTTQGTLFKRDLSGRPVVVGLDSAADKLEKAEKAAKVKQILSK